MVFKKNCEKAEEQYAPRRVAEILHDYLENSNEPLAVAYRERAAAKADASDQLLRHIFPNGYPNTEPCIDLKLLTRKPGRLDVGKYLLGAITRDGDCHYTFIEKTKMQQPRRRHNKHLYKGMLCNFVSHPDNKIRLTSNQLWTIEDDAGWEILEHAIIYDLSLARAKWRKEKGLEGDECDDD